MAIQPHIILSVVLGAIFVIVVTLCGTLLPAPPQLPISGGDGGGDASLITLQSPTHIKWAGEEPDAFTIRKANTYDHVASSKSLWLDVRGDGMYLESGHYIEIVTTKSPNSYTLLQSNAIYLYSSAEFHSEPTSEIVIRQGFIQLRTNVVELFATDTIHQTATSYIFEHTFDGPLESFPDIGNGDGPKSFVETHVGIPSYPFVNPRTGFVQRYPARQLSLSPPHAYYKKKLNDTSFIYGYNYYVPYSTAILLPLQLLPGDEFNSELVGVGLEMSCIRYSFILWDKPTYPDLFQDSPNILPHSTPITPKKLMTGTRLEIGSKILIDPTVTEEPIVIAQFVVSAVQNVTNENGNGSVPLPVTTQKVVMDMSVHANEAHLLIRGSGAAMISFWAPALRTPSDERLKKNIVAVTGEEAMQNLKSVSVDAYDYTEEYLNETKREDTRQHAFIAQKMLGTVYRGGVAVEKKSRYVSANLPKDMLTFDKTVLIGDMVAAIKLLATRLEQAEAQLAALAVAVTATSA